jgi:hypothetical protein
MGDLFDVRWLLWPAGLYLAYWLFWRPATPIFYRGQHQADVPRFIQSVFMLLRPGSVIHMQHEGSSRRLRLRKVVLPADRDGIRLELPRGAGAEDYEGAVRTALTAAGFACSAPPPLDRLWPAQEPALLIVDSLSAIDAFRAVEVARAAIGLEQDARFTIHMEGPPSLAATRKYLAARS